MKKITLLLFGIFSMLNVSNAQDITVFDFDGTTPTFDSWSDIFTSTANPVSDGVNSSANVGKYTHGAQWSNVSTTVDIDPRFYTSFNIDVYSPVAGTVVVVCYDASGNQLDWYSESVTAATGWTKLTRNLNFVTKIAKVAVGFNTNSVPVGGSSDVVYFDNLVFKKTSDTMITLYSENFFASWSQWGDWTGAPSTQAGKWTGGINLESAGDGNITIGRDWDTHEGVLKVTPASPAITISNINITGFSGIQLVFDTQWPWSAGENEAFYASTFYPVIEINNGSGWVAVTTSALTGSWAAQTIPLTGIDDAQPLSLRISSLGGITYKIDNLKIQGTQKSNTAVSQTNANDFLQVYPNPTSEYIMFPKSDKVQIFNVNGQLVRSSVNSEKEDVSLLPDGMYIVKVTIENRVKQSRFIKR